MAQPASNFLGLDVGDRRIGLAVASSEARLPRPLGMIERTELTISRLKQIIEDEQIGLLVVGLPRNLAGETTNQTRAVEAFAADLEALNVPIVLQDESLTSVKAEEELKRRGKPYAKGDVDALAATYILDDYLRREYR